RGRPDEDAVAELGGLIDQRVVLQLAAFADRDPGADVRPASHHALLAQPGALPDLRQLPHRGALPDLRRLVDLGGGLDADRHAPSLDIPLREGCPAACRTTLT